jgi:hypothetical protein
VNVEIALVGGIVKKALSSKIAIFIYGFMAGWASYMIAIILIMKYGWM